MELDEVLRTRNELNKVVETYKRLGINKQQLEGWTIRELWNDLTQRIEKPGR
jgi:5'(3')-deoxyribonucleotidase